MADLIVSAPMVMVTTDAGFNLHLYRGDVLPDNVSKESVKHLKESGLLAKDKDEFVTQPDDAEPDAEQAEDSDDDAPGGNASLEDWQDYARSQGASEEDLADKNRNDLRDEFGR